jgi:hypothetical protein
MKSFLFVPFLVLILSVSEVSIAQETPKRFRTSGALAGIGKTFSDNTVYKVYFLVGDYSQSFSKPVKSDFLAWYAEPQFNLVKTLKPNGPDLEFGLNLGIRNYIRINKGFYLYQMLGSGPHYITADLDRQATGFIFSDNLILGSLLLLNKNQMLNIQAGVRHISNANIKLPNRGVNTFVFRLGLSGLH